MPRSAVIEQSNKRYTTYFADLPSAKIDDVTEAIRILLDLQKKTDNPEANKMLILSLQEVERTRLLISAKEWGKIHANCFISSYLHDPPSMPQTIDYLFRQFLLAHAVTGFLELPERYQIPPKDGETANTLLERITTLARDEKDLRALWRILAYRDYLQWARFYPSYNNFLPISRVPPNHPSRRSEEPALSGLIFYGTPWEKGELAATDLCLRAEKLADENSLPFCLTLSGRHDTCRSRH
jgi:hypothetical protein